MTPTPAPATHDRAIDRLAFRPEIRTPDLALPAGACDCHCHVIGAPGAGELSPDRGYTPPEAALPAYLNMARVLKLARCVLVQPSVYGTDNRVMLDALDQLGDAARGVVVVDPQVTDEELRALHDRNVRGIRINTACPGGLRLEDAKRLAPRIAPLGWHLQLFCGLADIRGNAEWLGGLDVPIVIDHFGFPANSDEAATLRALRTEYDFWFKLSAPYRISAAPHPYDVAAYLDALLQRGTERLLWGTDWPHTDLSAHMPDDGDLCDLLADWLPDAAQRQVVLVTNPEHLYGFAAQDR